MSSGATWLLAAACLAAAPAWCQELTPVPPPTMRCLTAAADSPVPVYPARQREFRFSGNVQAELTFNAADLAPDIRILSSDSDAEFVDAVRDHVKKLRVPCMQRGEPPARLVQNYRFTPDERPTYGSSTDPDQAARKEQLQCLQINYRQPPGYPIAARQAGLQGRVLLRMTVEAPDRAPVFETFAPSYFDVLERAVSNWAREQRMPCFNGPPLKTFMVFMFRMEDGEFYGFRDIEFTTFLRGIRGIQNQRLSFDTTQMGCPFDVRLTYLQPLQPNVLRQIGDLQPARQPLLEWLSKAELELSNQRQAAAFGDSFAMTVPCIKIDLAPQG